MLGDTLWMIVTFLFTIFAFLSVPPYPIAQVAVVILRRGIGMWLSLLPIPPMLYSYTFFHHYWQQAGDNNLSPLILIFSSPFAFGWVLFTGYFASRRDIAAALDRLLSRRRD